MYKKVLMLDPDHFSTFSSLKTLGKKKIPVIIADSNFFGVSNWSKYKYKKIKSFGFKKGTKELIKWILELAVNQEIDTIIPTTDKSIWLLSEHRKQLEKYIELNIPSIKATRICLFKDLTYKTLKKNGFNYLKYYSPTNRRELENISDKIKYPIIIKPRSTVYLKFKGKGCIVHNKEELLDKYELNEYSYDEDYINKKFPKLKWPILQEYVKNPVENIEQVSGYIDKNGNPVCITVTKKIRQFPPKLGIAVVAKVIKNDELINT